MRRPGFVVDIYVHRRTQEFAVARIDNKDEKTLHKVKEIVSRFEF
jgi:endonuclease III